MKNLKSIIVMAIAASLLMSSCTKDSLLIHGEGNLVSETLQLDDFNSIIMEGVSDVHITYGEYQEVIVTGHANIIDRIKTDVQNDIWNMRLTNGRYGDFELTYYITLPRIEKIVSKGTGSIVVEEFIQQDFLDITIEGLGGFYGFEMPVNECQILIEGAGKCEVSVEENLDVKIKGTGDVYYKGNPSVSRNISGIGRIINVD